MLLRRTADTTPFDPLNTVPSSSRPEFCREAFTVVEMLVVIVTMALLATLLLPALKAAREAGDAAACQHNLRALSSAAFTYAADNSGSLLPTLGSGSENWQSVLIVQGYLPKVTPTSPTYILKRNFMCPANHNGALPSSLTNSSCRDGTPNYAYNATVGTLDPNYNTNNRYPPKRLGSIQQPSKKAMFMDAGVYRALNTPYRSSAGMTRIGSPDSSYFDTNSTYYTVGDVHRNAANFLFFDGHIERIPRGQVDWRISDLDTP